MTMRFSKVRLIAVLSLFSVIVGLELFFSYTYGDKQSKRLSSPEEKSWISGESNNSNTKLPLRQCCSFNVSF